MVQQPKKEDFLAYSYAILDKNWPRILKKLGLFEDAIIKPGIEFIKGCSRYEPDTLKIRYDSALRAYFDKRITLQGLEIKYETVLEGSIIHESVHHVQNKFYDIHKKSYNYVNEGLADLVTAETRIENKNYEIVTITLACCFIEAKKPYKDYFNLPRKYNKHIEDIIKEGTYKPPKRSLAYAKGFLHICENYRKGSYLYLLLEPFKNCEVDSLEKTNPKE